MLVGFVQEMFPGVSAEDIGVWPADDVVARSSTSQSASPVPRIADQALRVGEDRRPSTSKGLMHRSNSDGKHRGG
jgi:hypothetical protein